MIREAVKSLAAKGMLESRTRTGIRVLSPIHWNLLDPEVLGWRYSAMPPAQFFREIFEIRGLIEPQAARVRRRAGEQSRDRRDRRRLRRDGGGRPARRPPRSTPICASTAPFSPAPTTTCCCRWGT